MVWVFYKKNTWSNFFPRNSVVTRYLNFYDHFNLIVVAAQNWLSTEQFTGFG